MIRPIRATPAPVLTPILALGFLLAGATSPWGTAGAQVNAALSGQNPPAANKTPPPVMPSIVRPGAAGGADERLAPRVVGNPTAPGAGGEAAGRSGTGFFVAADGSLLTAAHVVQGCARIQIVSEHVPRTWASPIAIDATHDIALLRAAEAKPPAIAAISPLPPVNTRLLVLGYPASGGLTVASETPAHLENQTFPDSVRALANPRDLLWLSAPGVTLGYSGGPVFDPASGAVVGLVKGTVGGGYLRLIRGVPTTGIAIGPGIAHFAALLRRESPFMAVRMGATGDGVETLRRATVHVLCWQ